MREVIGDEGGLVVPPGDVVALGRVLEVVQHLDRRRVRRHAVQHCSLSRMLDDYEAVYTAMIDGDPGRAFAPRRAG